MVTIENVKEAFIQATESVDTDMVAEILFRLGDEASDFKADAFDKNMSLEEVLELYNWKVWYEECSVCREVATFYDTWTNRKLEPKVESAKYATIELNCMTGKLAVCKDCVDELEDALWVSVKYT